MANSLLDFVMSLRDPDVAARYAEDPDGTIADAGLTDVTSADVSNLIPVVSESLSTAVPTAGSDGVIGDVAANVWASGAATAAFDAFEDHVPVTTVDDAPPLIADYVDQPDQALQSGLDALADAGVPGVVGAEDASMQFDQPTIDDVPAAELPATSDLDDAIAEVDDLNSDASGFDIL